MMDEKLRKESHDKIIFFLAQPENRDKEFDYGELYDSLKLPPGYQRTVWQSLANWKTGYVESKNGILPNVKIWITPKGIEYAATEQAKNDKARSLQLIEKYKIAALNSLKEYGIGKETVWNNTAKKAGIPDDYTDDIKNIMYYEGLMVKTKSAQGIGDLVRGQPSITAYLLGLPKSEISKSESKIIQPSIDKNFYEILRLLQVPEIDKRINNFAESAIDHSFAFSHSLAFVAYLVDLTRLGYIGINEKNEYFIKPKGMVAFESYQSDRYPIVTIEKSTTSAMKSGMNEDTQPLRLLESLPIAKPTAQKQNKVMAILIKTGLWIISHMVQIIVGALSTALGAYYIIKCNVPH